MLLLRYSLAAGGSQPGISQLTLSSEVVWGGLERRLIAVTKAVPGAKK